MTLSPEHRTPTTDHQTPSTVVGRLIRFCLENKLIVGLLVLFFVVCGIVVAPFDFDLGWFPRKPVPVDAIPDYSENQQIVFTDWPGHSPQDVQDRITLPLTSTLLGTDGVKSIRASSMFGFSSIYVIFKEGVDLDTARNRLNSKLQSLPRDMPDGVQPKLGPEATPVGQIFWYTLEGRDEDGKPTPGVWALHELRTIQDWYLRFDLLAAKDAEGDKPIAEVASVGGHTREYQVDVKPVALREHGVTLDQVFRAIKRSNIDVGARTMEINNVEYFVRGLGYVKSVEDIENSVVAVEDNVPLYVKDVAHVTLGPAPRRGALDKEGAEAVGGVVVVRYGANPLSAIKAVKDKLSTLGRRVDEPDGPFWLLHDQVRDLPGGGKSRVAVVPFYDRTGLIYETLDTLREALALEVLVTIIVVLVMVRHVRSSLLIAATLPLAILMCFIAMKVFGVDANIVALSGIAIAIGTIVDMGIVMCENIVRRLGEAGPDERRGEVIFRAASEVGGAVLTAVATTIVGFLPVFFMRGDAGKLFRPLAFTKTFVLLASIIVALTVIPVGARLLLRKRRPRPKRGAGGWASWIPILILVLIAAVLLTRYWMPLGPESNSILNFLFIVAMIGGLLAFFGVYRWLYPHLLRWCLAYKLAFLCVPGLLVLLGLTIWLGFDTIFGPVPKAAKSDGRTTFREGVSKKFPGLGREFMPPLDEGSFLYMPSTMPHASFGTSLRILKQLDMAIKSVPEVDLVVGKIGRAESPLDPAPVQMVETVITYKPEYGTNAKGERVRQWRDSVRSPDDIWKEIEKAAAMPGVTGAPKLQPIRTRIVMLQSGMRAKMGVKVFGPSLEAIQGAALRIERALRDVPSVNPATVSADRLIGKPYLEITPDRAVAGARYGLTVKDIQDVIEVAIGGKPITTTVEGRESYAVRARYPRERRELEELGKVLVATPSGAQVPLVQLTNLDDLDAVYRSGPVSIKSEDTYLVGYVTFGTQPGEPEVDAVEECRRILGEKIAAGELVLPEGVRYEFAGTYESQVRARRTLAWLLPLALFVIFIILYLQFRRVPTTLIVFSAIAVAWAGGFLLIWLYNQPGFLNVTLFDVNLRELFQMPAVDAEGALVSTVKLSVAVWVGFLALFGIASDDGVVMTTYLNQAFERRRPGSLDEIRDAVIAAAERRIRPCLMTSATTILALLPVLTSTGRGADVMVPMAIPSFGGMLVVLVSTLMTPVLYSWLEERRAASAQAAPGGP